MWPTPQDYNEAVQTPILAFADDQLRGCLPELNSLGLPKPVSGSFASVYQMRAKDGKQWAVRCFLRNVPNQEERYAAISDHLAMQPLDCMVPFEFVRQGIRISGQWFPILKMQWVEGVPLIEWIARHADDVTALTTLQNTFSGVLKTLAENGIAHGDLQHGNIFVTNNGAGMKLVDYDGLYVPALASMGSAELGHRHYQHPGRTGDHFGPWLDNFSAWSIWSSLHCLAQDARLWRRLGGGEECLLFRQEDYASPNDSVAFSFLEHHDSKVVRETSETMRRLLTLPVPHIPALGEPVLGARQIDRMPPLTVPAAKSSQPADLVKNLRVAVAEANAPTLVVDPPRVKVKVAVEQPRAPQSPAGLGSWNQSTTTPPTQRQKPKRIGPFRSTALIYIIAGLASVVMNSKIWQHNPAPTSHSAPTVLLSEAHPISIKDESTVAREPSEAVQQYEDAYAQFKKKNFYEAYERFMNLRRIAWVEPADKHLCEYMAAKSLLKAGHLTDDQKTDAVNLLYSASEGLKAYHLWLPDAAFELAQTQLALKQPLQAAQNLFADLSYCKDSLWRANKISLLRTAALQTLELGEPAGIRSYDEYFLLLSVDPIGRTIIPEDQLAQRTYNDLEPVIQHLVENHKYELAQTLCAQGKRYVKTPILTTADTPSLLLQFDRLEQQVKMARAKNPEAP